MLPSHVKADLSDTRCSYLTPGLTCVRRMWHRTQQRAAGDACPEVTHERHTAPPPAGRALLSLRRPAAGPPVRLLSSLPPPAPGACSVRRPRGASVGCVGGVALPVASIRGRRGRPDGVACSLDLEHGQLLVCHCSMPRCGGAGPRLDIDLELRRLAERAG